MDMSKLFSLILFSLLSVGFCVSASAQACGSAQWLDQRSIPNTTVEFRQGSNGVFFLEPSTTYTVRVSTRAAGICEVFGYGCDGANAPISYTVEYFNGCTISGGVSKDAGHSGSSTLAIYTITTNPPSTFGGQVVLSIRFFGTQVNSCTTIRSNNVLIKRQG